MASRNLFSNGGYVDLATNEKFDAPTEADALKLDTLLVGVFMSMNCYSGKLNNS